MVAVNAGNGGVRRTYMVAIKTGAVWPPSTTGDGGGRAWSPSTLEMGDMGGGRT